MDKLTKYIKAEEEQILETLEALEEALKRNKKEIIELAAIAAFLHNIYNGMENLLIRILKFKKIAIPSSQTWHRDLLDLSIKENIISIEISNRLSEFLAFRHFFTHGYGIKLDKEKLMPLAKKIFFLWKDFNENLNQTLKNLK